jgi:mannosyltransferase OCH1-like enzyme
MNTILKYIKPYRYVIIFIIVFLLVFVLHFFTYLRSFEHFDNKNSVIPRQVFLTWETKDLPPKMAASVEKLKRDNPELVYYLYDNKERRNFIVKNFDNDIVKAYDALIPGAYRADLWRYCILYKLGGIYLDIKYHTVNGFKLVTMTDKEYFIRDIEPSGSGIYNAFIITKPGNKKLMNCINDLVKNVKNKYYGNSALYPTGPMLLINQFNENELSKFDNIALSTEKCPTHLCINKDGKTILAFYDGYPDEKQQYFSQNNTKNYTDLWGEKKIYNDSVIF